MSRGMTLNRAIKHCEEKAAEREHDMKRLERAIGIFQKTRKIYKGDTIVCMTMNTNDVAEILGWLEELKEHRATSLPSGTER